MQTQNILQIQEITKQFIANNIHFSIRHFRIITTGKFTTEIFTKDAINAKLLFPKLFDIGFDVNKAKVATAFFSYDK